MTSESPEDAVEDLYADYPPRLYRPKEPGRLRQGDIVLAFFHQLRSPKDAPGPGPRTVEGRNLPFFGPFYDREFKVGKRGLLVRVWPCWVMVLNQGCDLEHQDENDSRVTVAPVVFRAMWPGDARWSQIRSGDAPGFVFLPRMREDDRSRTKSPGGWPLDTEAAVALACTATIGRAALGEPAFGLSVEMQHLLQERLVTHWSVRDWKSFKQRNELLGKQIVQVSETDEKFDGPSKLYKMHLADPGGESGDDEATVGILFRK